MRRASTARRPHRTPNRTCRSARLERRMLLEEIDDHAEVGEEISEWLLADDLVIVDTFHCCRCGLRLELVQGRAGTRGLGVEGPRPRPPRRWPRGRHGGGTARRRTRCTAPRGCSAARASMCRALMTTLSTDAAFTSTVSAEKPPSTGIALDADARLARIVVDEPDDARVASSRPSSSRMTSAPPSPAP